MQQETMKGTIIFYLEKCGNVRGSILTETAHSDQALQ